MFLLRIMETLYTFTTYTYLIGQKNVIRAIGWYYLFIIMYMAGYDNANDSRKYVPAKHKACTMPH